MPRSRRPMALAVAIILTSACAKSSPVDDGFSVQPPALPLIRAGTDDTCAIDADGRLLCWGTLLDDLLDDQEGTFVDVSVGGEALAIRADGTAQWFPPRGEEFEFPHDDYVQAINGFGPPCALRRDGQVDCLNVERNLLPFAVPPAQRIARLDNSFALCGIAEDTTAICWGDLDPLPGTGIVQVASMDWAGSCALYDDGRVQCNGDMGQPSPDNRYTSIAVAYSDACGVLLDGELDCWGPEGPLANPFWDPLPPGPFTQISLGSGQACAIRADLGVICGASSENEGGVEGHPLSLAGGALPR